jgi:hypothetical protein
LESVQPRRPGKRARWAIAAAGVVAAVLIAAIVFDLGPFADELTEQDLIAKGDEICSEAHDAFTDLQQRPPTTARAAADLTEQLIHISEDELDQLRDLNAPAELDDELDRYLASREEAIDLMHDGLDAANDDDAFAYADAQAKIAAGQVERLKLARAVGFTECSRPLIDRELLAEQAETPTSPNPDAPPVVSNPPGFFRSGGDDQGAVGN